MEFRERIKPNNLIFSPHDWEVMGHQKRDVSILSLLDNINISIVVHSSSE